MTGHARAVPAALGVLLAACSTSPGPADYREQASLTLGTAVSEVATTRLVLDELDQGDTFRPATITQLRSSEESLGSVAQSFGSLNPPPSEDPVHRRSTTLLGDAEDLLAAVRIAVHRRSADDYPGLVDQLRRVGRQLEELEADVRP